MVEIKSEIQPGPPSLPQRWFFYNLKQSIDDPYKAFSAAVLDSATSRDSQEIPVTSSDTDSDMDASDDSEASEVRKDTPSSTFDAAANSSSTGKPLFSKSSLRRTVSPVTEWIAFSPCDNAKLNSADPSDDPVPVGHEKLLFEVHNLNRLKPIYWQIAYSTLVTSSHWVFSDTLTPINPVWDTAILHHYQSFVANAQEYHQTLIQAIEDPTVLRKLVVSLDLPQAGRVLAFEVLFSMMNGYVYLFKAGSGYSTTKQACQAMLAGTTPRGIVCVLRPFDFNIYKALYSLPDRPSDDASYEPLPINNLIMVFHGVGQKLSNSYTRVNFVYAIDKLRVEILKATETPEVNSHFPQAVRNLVLAVNWRSAFDAEHIPDLADITVPSLPTVRQAFSDALLDIPLYMSENRRPAMLAAAASEANRIYDLVAAHHHGFREHGRTHIVGHSLGSLITGDLLTHQPTKLTEETWNQAPFKFETTNYFTTGSMLGVFLLLKGRCIIPRQEYEQSLRDQGLSDDPQTRPVGCFAVRNLYNISHPFDLLSFHLNSTVKSAELDALKNLTGSKGYRLEADELPSPNCTIASPELGKASTDPDNSYASDSSRSSSFGSLGRFFTSSLSKLRSEDKSILPTEPEQIVDPENYPGEVKAVIDRLQALNDNGQLDWKLPQPLSLIPSHYLKMFTAHFDYWSNKEIARFLAIECGRSLGKEHTLPAHRPKWQLKVAHK